MRCSKGKSLRGKLYSAFSGPLFTLYWITFRNSTELSCLHYTGELFVPAQKSFQYNVNVAQVIHWIELKPGFHGVTGVIRPGGFAGGTKVNISSRS